MLICTEGEDDSAGSAGAGAGAMQGKRKKGRDVEETQVVDEEENHEEATQTVDDKPKPAKRARKNTGRR